MLNFDLTISPEMDDSVAYPTDISGWQTLALNRGAALCVLVSALGYCEKYLDAETMQTIFNYAREVKRDPTILIKFDVGESWLKQS